MTRAATTARQAIEAVATSVGATWEPGAAPTDAVLTLVGKRIALTVGMFEETSGEPPKTARLREDRVALRFLANLEGAVGAATPGDRTVIVTLAAPVRLANRTLAALAPVLADRAANGVLGREDSFDLHGNRIRFCILGNGDAWISRVAGFVFTTDPGPLVVVQAVQALCARIAAVLATSPPTAFCARRWLVLAGGNPVAEAATLRRALAQRAIPNGFERILMITSGARVEQLSG